jgi:hypothetical protein
MKAPANGAAAKPPLPTVTLTRCLPRWHTRRCVPETAISKRTGRRGKKRAIGAVKHSLLVTVYFMLRDNKPYKDLGVDYFNKVNPQQRIRYHVRRLQELGQEVELSPIAA